MLLSHCVEYSANVIAMPPYLVGIWCPCSQTQKIPLRRPVSETNSVAVIGVWHCEQSFTYFGPLAPTRLARAVFDSGEVAFLSTVATMYSCLSLKIRAQLEAFVKRWVYSVVSQPARQALSTGVAGLL